MMPLSLTIWLALVLYTFALGGRLWCGPLWRVSPVAQRRSRWFWSAACLAYLVHVFLAFELVHGWSHAHAFAHVEEQSGFGPGIFVSYFFTFLWCADVAWWWLFPKAYLSRPVWLEASVHGFLFFIIFNGAVVFATGASRLLGVALCLALGLAGWRGARRRALRPPPGWPTP